MLSTDSDITTCTQSVGVSRAWSVERTQTLKMFGALRKLVCVDVTRIKTVFCAGTCPIGSPVSEHGVWPTVRTYGHWPTTREVPVSLYSCCMVCCVFSILALHRGMWRSRTFENKFIACLLTLRILLQFWFAETWYSTTSRETKRWSQQAISSPEKGMQGKVWDKLLAVV